MQKSIIFILSLLIPVLGFSDYTISEGKLVAKEQVASEPVQEHYSAMIRAFENQEWDELAQEALIVIRNFSKTAFAKDATYFLGVAYFNQKDYEMANYQFTDYLIQQATPKYFEEAIQYKFEIAEKFRKGARKHLMGFKSMPKWAPAGSEAITIYDEVISALPHHDLAATPLL